MAGIDTAPGRRRRVLIAAAGLVVALAAVLAVTGFGGSAHSPPKRGRLLTLSVTAHPLHVDEVAISRHVARIRKAVHAPAVVKSTCLDQLAAAAVRRFAAGEVPTRLGAGCGPTQWGWVAGSDPTGVEQAKAALARPAAYTSPLIDSSMRSLGYAMGRQVISGQATGYVLVWVVGA